VSQRGTVTLRRGQPCFGNNPARKKISLKTIYYLEVRKTQHLSSDFDVTGQRSDDLGFYPSTQRHYRRLIYYLYIRSYMFRSYDHHRAENVLLS
jgi:hypothetical protein